MWLVYIILNLQDDSLLGRSSKPIVNSKSNNYLSNMPVDILSQSKPVNTEMNNFYNSLMFHTLSIVR